VILKYNFTQKNQKEEKNNPIYQDFVQSTQRLDTFSIVDTLFNDNGNRIVGAVTMY
jgi:hypothetical protein